MDKETKNKIANKLAHSRNRNELLANTTTAERTAHEILRKLGIRTVRQQPFFTGRSTFYADIYIPSLRLVIEIDGGYHFTDEQKRKDENRSAALRRLGVHVCRLSNRDAKNPEKVRTKILRYMKR